MRVTSNTFPNSLSQQLSKLNQRQTLLNQQAATGQRILNPEDDPAAVHRVMDMQRDAKTLGQYQRNITQMTDQTKVSYENIKSLKTLLSRAQELATKSGGIRSQDELDIYAQEVNQLIKSGVQTMNGKFKGDFLFAGTKSDAAPFVAAEDSSGNVTSVTYQGNAEVPVNEIGEGVTATANVLGANTSGSGPRGVVTDSRYGADFFNHLIALRSALQSGNTGTITSTINPGMASDEDNILIHVGLNGAIQAQLEAAGKLAANDQMTLSSAISNEADADIAQTLLKLTQTQTAYQAALQSGAKILSQSLLDYLR